VRTRPRCRNNPKVMTFGACALLQSFANHSWRGAGVEALRQFASAPRQIGSLGGVARQFDGSVVFLA
jgi:hypothetical protein